MSLAKFVIYFVITSFIGYIYETIAMSLWGGKWENRGFLFGPIIPIYGFGATLGTIVFDFIYPNTSPLIIFLSGAIVSFILEYPTHYFLEKVFHQKWWDYTKAPFNINGRVCLPATLGFGLGGLVIILVINPIILPIVQSISNTVADVIGFFLTIFVSVDVATTVAYISDFEDRVAYYNDKLDKKLGDKIDNVLDEDNALKDKFYSAVDKVSEGKDAIIENADNVIDGIMEKTSGLYKITLKRFVKYRKNIVERFTDKDER